MNAITLFSGAGIDEVYLSKIGIDVLIANELVEKRARIHKWLYPNCQMINGDICDTNIKNEIKKAIKLKNIDLLIATPPCQGMSIAGKNRNNNDMLNDERNHLIFNVFEFIDEFKFKYILIENVPRFLKVKYWNQLKKKYYNIIDYLKEKYQNEYYIKSEVVDCADYGIAQSRKRAIIRMYKKNLEWEMPKKENIITLKDAIGYLPSLESGDRSNIKYHYSRIHSNNHIEWMKHTPTGESALNNKEYYPKKKNGEKIKGYKTCYKRMEWDKPAPTITMRNDAISSQNNVHPGRLQKDGTYSDACVLTIKELFILMSLPDNFILPDYLSDTEIRQILGEAIPPLLTRKILEGIKI